MHKISIIVPIYNVEKYLPRCIDSILNQSYPNFEIILVDDKSPDRSPQLCDKYATQHDNIVVVHKSINEGLGLARNTGLQYVTGDFVCFVDSDDYIHENYIETMYTSIMRNKSDLVFCNFYQQEPNESYINVVEDLDATYGDSCLHDICCSLLTRRSVMVWRCMYNIEIIKDNNLLFISERVWPSEDKFFQFAYIKCCKKISFVKECLYYYTYNSSSLARSYNSSKLWKFFEERNELLKFFKTEEWRKSVNIRFTASIYSEINKLINSTKIKQDKLSIIKQIKDQKVWREMWSNGSIKHFSKYEMFCLFILCCPPSMIYRFLHR